MSETKLDYSKDALAETVRDRTVTGNLDYKTAAVLCYTPLLLISFIAPLVWLATEPKSNRQLRFHAIQGLALFSAAFALGLLNSMLAGMLLAVLGFAALPIMHLSSCLLGLSFFGISLYGMYCTYKGQEFRLPLLSEIADGNL